MCRPLRALIWTLAALLAALVGSPLADAAAQPSDDTYVVLIGGLGGQPTYTDKFAGYLRETRRHLEQRYDIGSGRIIVLAEELIAAEPFVDGVATADEIRNTFRRLADQISPDDQLFVILYGHGSFDGTHAKLNIPREDLGDADYRELLDGSEAGRIVFINTAPASGPFAEVLSGPDRVIAAATASGTERDETRFAQHLVEALGSPASDLDRDGRTSVGELVSYAAEETARTFEVSGQLATEHAVLDDNGDGRPVRISELSGADEGHLAFATYLRAEPLATANPAQRPLLREKQSIEEQIAELKGRKSQLREDVYYDQLKDLFIRLARLNERIEGAANSAGHTPEVAH